ncbi:MAG TPA: phospholipase D-like domain-containing protein [Methanoregulaceae archaeon]|nr:phospholipase D-like domain-containing protein [Methanoregulaceae archaeon]
MNVIPAFLVFFLLLPPVYAGVITEFCPDTYLSGDPDEYIVFSADGNLDGTMITDGEGGFRFPAGTMGAGKIIVARNGSAYTLVHHQSPDFEIRNYSPLIPDLITSGNFQMGNPRDELLVYEGNRLIQKITWPGDVTPREGQVHYYSDGTWDKRVLMIGQSRLTAKTFEGVSGTCFITPDCSEEVYRHFIDNAGSEILVNVYEFTSPVMADALINAHKRGVNVTVLLEGGPVGGISAAENEICNRLTKEHIPVFLMGTTGTSHAPYRYNHAKYIVVDGKALFITSENFTNNGFPGTGDTGNRGWGICLYDRAAASYFRNVFLGDVHGDGIFPTQGKPGNIMEVPHVEHAREFSPESYCALNVTPVIAPDTSYLIGDLLNGAQEQIDIEQAYITNESPGVLNPYLGEAVNASRRGVHVRVLLDSYWFNTDGPNDNDELVAYINQVAKDEGLPLEARCAGLEENQIEKIHNKGVIVDSRKVLISSINWNTNSPTFNREAGVIIESPETGRYYGRAFTDDWDSTGPVNSNDPLEQHVKLVIVGIVICGLIVLYWKRNR